MASLERDVSMRAPILVRAVKKPLSVLSGGLGKTEKVVQVGEAYAPRRCHDALTPAVVAGRVLSVQAV
jgi:hypothetical protein